MNRMKEIANMLGVEFGERFYICRTVGSKHYCGEYYFNNSGLYYDRKEPFRESLSSPDIFNELLNGTAEIKKIQKHTGLEHPGYDGIIYSLDGGQYTDNSRDKLTPLEFSDKQLRDDYARAMDIYRRLVEAAAMLNGSPIDKLDLGIFNYYIYWDACDKNLCLGNTYSVCDLTVFFESEQAAEKAIEIVGKDDLIWLFRGFQPYIGAYVTEVK